MDSEKEIERETYLEERRALINAENEQSRLFDRAILTLTAGAFGLSITFIGDIIPSIEKGTFGWLIAGWVGFIFSLLATLISFQTSQSALQRQREILDDLHSSNTQSNPSENGPADLTNRLNKASLVFFIAGIACYTIFVLLNLQRQ